MPVGGRAVGFGDDGEIGGWNLSSKLDLSADTGMVLWIFDGIGFHRVGFNSRQ